ncbi:hypothetical protein V493_02453 [Pseudogymnoascus sp. VKM F-4281 (FW-2241)]|nr:hypothetical protein V493_02453 [Pseudogymnoascus sp. VKM F-4281 (FW-2241)]
MTGLALKAGLRAAAPLRRPPPLLRRQPAPKRTTSTNTPKTPAPRTTTTTPSPGDTIPIAGSIPLLPLWQRLGPLTTAISLFSRAQRSRPWTTQFVSTVIVYFLGDLSAQRIGGGDYEPERTGRALVIGAVAAIPCYSWFVYLGNSFNYASTLLSLATKVVVNQIAFTPIFNSYFFGMQSLLSHPLSASSLENAVEHVKRTVPTSFVNSCKLWPIVTAFSFAFLPPDFRNIFGGVIAIGWQAYLSFLNRKVEGVEREDERRECQKLLEEDGKEVVGERIGKVNVTTA